MYFSPTQKLNIFLTLIFSIFFLVPINTLAASGSLVIDEFRIYGEKSNDEYLVIANYDTKAINLGGYRLVKRAKSTTDYKLVDNFGDFTLLPGKKIVVAHTGYTGPRDFTFFTGSSNTLADNNSIFLLAPDKSIVDLVGYGDAIYYEGAPLAAPSGDEVYTRVDGLDTDDNSADFVLQKAVLQLDTNADKIVISELLPSPASGDEWFELYNPTNLDISLMNLKICDVLGSKHCYYFGSGDTISAGSYKTYNQAVTKITLNNTGDWLELYDTADNLLTDSGGDYGAADKGISLSVFGSDYRWTSQPTQGAANVYVDTIEVEADIAPKTTTKKSKAKVVAAAKKSSIAAPSSDSDTENIENETTDEAVKAAKTSTISEVLTQPLIGKKTLGWVLIGLAILLLVGYTLWYFRDYAKEIYHKIRPGDDSARF